MIQTKTVDITPMKITLPVIEMSQYDLGREVIVHMKDGSDWFDLTGYTAKLQGTKPSGFGYTVDGVVNGHDITFASNYDMTSEAGFIPSEVRLTKDGVSLGSLNVILHVEKTPHDVTVTDGSPETIIPEMTELVERAEAAAEILLDCSAIATTLPAGSSATASYDVDNGVFTFGIPRGNKGETGDTGETGNGIASITKTGTSGLVDTYTITYTNGQTTTFTVTNGQNGTGSVADVWQNGVSVLDGTTAKVTVPTYDAVTDNEPYLFRTSGGGLSIGNRETDLLVGGTVAWNQLAKDRRTGTLIRESVRTVSILTGGISSVVGHKYCALVNIKSDTTMNGMAFQFGSSNMLEQGAGRKAIIFQASSVLTFIYGYIGSDEASDATVEYENFCLFDLTQMFGSTIADYIYGLEQSSAGAGVAWFKKLFPNDYYEYNAGELISVSGLQSHDMVGFNMWDEEWEVGGLANATGLPFSINDRIRSKNFSKCLLNTDYYCKTTTTYLRVFWYDSEQNFISMMNNVANLVITSPSNARYFKIVLEGTTTYNNDICINISDTAKNGTYEPYVKHSYPLDDSLTLRGIPKLSNGKLYYDGDTYASDGTVTRKYGVVDLGTLAWTYNSNSLYFYSNYADAKPSVNDNTVANIICSKYPFTYRNEIENSGVDKVIAVNARHFISVKDTAYTDAASFKTAMSGVYLVYELATPTTETAEPYTNPQIVDNSGTEEYVSTSIVPVGHQTTYPDLFSGDYNDLVNKPTIPTKTSDLTNDSNFVSDGSYVHTDNNYTTTEQTKLSGIASGAEVNVQADWNETDSTADAYIANKPDINELKVLVVNLASFSSLPQTFYETAVTADHVCIKAELGTPSAQTGDWTVTTSAGELNISGSISGSTTATLYLAIKQ